MFFRKCFICGESDGELDVIAQLENNLFKYRYHTGCLQGVLCGPENYETPIIERANKIGNEILNTKRYRKYMIEEARLKCKELKEKRYG